MGMNNARKNIAQSIVTAIESNVDALYADAIDHATFRAQQRELWKRANATETLSHNVSALMRGDVDDLR